MNGACSSVQVWGNGLLQYIHSIFPQTRMLLFDRKAVKMQSATLHMHAHIVTNDHAHIERTFVSVA